MAMECCAACLHGSALCLPDSLLLSALPCPHPSIVLPSHVLQGTPKDGCSAYHTLVQTFDEAYGGNRAPVTLGMHKAYLQQRSAWEWGDGLCKAAGTAGLQLECHFHSCCKDQAGRPLAATLAVEPEPASC